MNKYICIHGHFYQPPRENPWLEIIEPQASAHPYHDWNERITAECFAPNARCRILDERQRIVKIVNNYSRMSFNFGPTLLSWLETHEPEVYRAVLEGDQLSAEAFSGHGSAIAQAYNHIIMPLATSRQKDIQIRWGIRDFEHRFGRFPEGMWLPETAADTATLEALAGHGIRFTVLAPHQALSVRRIGEPEWLKVEADTLDTSRPYLANLPSGAKINLFFYDGPTSRAVAFEELLKDGETFASRLLSRFDPSSVGPQLVHIATDGETYGHHHRFGEMALAYAVDAIETTKLARITNYGEFLELFPPQWEVRIRENTSWSCVHGVQRWCGDCGCRTGYHADWRQAWRAPLRESLDWLAESVEAPFARQGSRLFKDPWAAFEDYIGVILDRSRDNVEDFLHRHAKQTIEGKDRALALKLMEIQRCVMLAFTSCGWFFDEISGIETTQVLLYAARAVQLADELFEEGLEDKFADLLEKAPSNLVEHGDGKRIYDKWARNAAVDLLKVGAHYALSALFEEYGEKTRIASFSIETERFRPLRAGRGRLAVGKMRVTSDVTLESELLTFAAFHLGEHILNGGVRPSQSEEAYGTLEADMEEAAERVDFPGLVRVLDKHFGTAIYSLDSLFRDERRKILNLILDPTVEEVETSLKSIYERQMPLMRYLESLGVDLPNSFETIARFVLNTDIRRALRAEEVELEAVQRLLTEADKRRVHLESEELSYEFRSTLGRLAQRAFGEDEDPALLGKLEALVDLTNALPLEIDLWQVQHLYYRRLSELDESVLKPVGDSSERMWLERFLALGEKLAVRPARIRISPS